MSANFSRVARHLADFLVEHADRDYPGSDGISKIRRAVFLDRGGHAPGESCPSELRKLRADWEAAPNEVAEQEAYDRLVDYVEAYGLNYTEHDPR